MLKKLELDALQADLTYVEKLLGERTEEDDPIGYFQFTARKSSIEEAIQKVQAVSENSAEMAIFFGGAPVQGSRGISADFAGKALEDIQALVAKNLSSKELGLLAQRGPLPLNNHSQLLVTGVMRGSFGFVLQEAGDIAEMIETPLKESVHDVAELLSRIAAPDELVFEDAAGGLDERVLVTLKQFFQRMDDSGATVRIVEGARDVLLDRQAVSRARQRVQHMQIDERADKLVGTLYLLPESKRFDFVMGEGAGRTVLKGSLGPVVLRQLEGQQSLDELPVDARLIPSKPWRVEMKTREIRERNRTPRRVYTLTRLLGPVNER